MGTLVRERHEMRHVSHVLPITQMKSLCYSRCMSKVNAQAHNLIPFRTTPTSDAASHLWCIDDFLLERDAVERDHGGDDSVEDDAAVGEQFAPVMRRNEGWGQGMGPRAQDWPQVNQSN